MKKLRHKYGITGYGLYWYCIELIAGSVNPKNITFELEEDAEIIALEWSLDQLKVQEIIAYMVQIGLFDVSENSNIRCFKLAKRLDDSNAKNIEVKRIVSMLNGEKKGDNPINSEKVREVPTRLEENRLEENRIDNKNILSSKPDTKPAVKKSKHDDLVKSVFDEWAHVMNKSANTKLTKERKKKIVDRCVEGYEFEDFKNAIYGCSITPHNMGANENGRLYNDIELICRTGTHLERFRDACKPVSPPQQYQSNPTRKKSLMERSHDDAQTALNIIERRAEQRQASHGNVHENDQLVRSQMAIEGRLIS